MQMISTARALEVVTGRIIKFGMLEQFSIAAELLNEDESEQQIDCSEAGP